MIDVIVFYTSELKKDALNRSIFHSPDIDWSFHYIQDRSPDFNEHLDSCLYGTESEYIMFLTDSDIFTHPFDDSCLKYFKNHEVLTISNRFISNEELIRWTNFGCSDWGRPIDIHGNIYRRSDLQWLLSGRICDDTDDLLRWGDIYSNEEGHLKPLIYINKPCIKTIEALSTSKDWDRGKCINVAPFMFLETDNHVYKTTYEIEWK